MCLYLYPNYKQKVAEEDIEAFKVVKRVESDGVLSYRSPFMGMTYEVGGEYSSDLIVQVSTVKPSSNNARYMLDYIFFIEDVGAYIYFVDEALHSFASVEDAKVFADSENGLARIMRCVIPKGTTYIEGDWLYLSSASSERHTVVKSFGSTDLIVKEIL